MTGIARHAKDQDTQSLCESVRTAANAICGLAEGAAQVLFLRGREKKSKKKCLEKFYLKKICLKKYYF